MTPKSSRELKHWKIGPQAHPEVVDLTNYLTSDNRIKHL